MAERQLRRMSVEELFAWQAKQDKLYELVDGAAVLPLKMMTGATQVHDRVVINIIAELANQLRRSPCRPTTDNLVVRISAKTLRRPDVTIECGGGDRRDMAVVEPRAVIEVLSPALRHCERSEAIQLFLRAAGLLRRFAPRNDESRSTDSGMIRRQRRSSASRTASAPSTAPIR